MVCLCVQDDKPQALASGYHTYTWTNHIHGVQCRMISVDNFFIFLRLLFFALMLLYAIIIIIIIIIVISIFKEDNVFSIIASLPYGPPVNTDIDYYRTIFRLFLFL